MLSDHDVFEVSMRASIFLLALVAACAPPPAVSGEELEAGEPTIDLVYPPPTTTEMMLEPDGSLKFAAVVDISGFEFLPPGSDPDAEDIVEGQGHWHLVLDPTDFYAPPVDVFYEAEVPAVAPGTYRIIVSLQNNNHTEIGCATCEDALEFLVVPYDDGADGE